MNSRPVSVRDLKISGFRERFHHGRIVDVRGATLPRHHSNAGQSRRLKLQRLRKEHKDAEREARAAINLCNTAAQSGQYTREALDELHAQATSLSVVEAAALKALRDFERAR